MQYPRCNESDQEKSCSREELLLLLLLLLLLYKEFISWRERDL
jgi:hypothetical protein